MTNSIDNIEKSLSPRAFECIKNAEDNFHMLNTFQKDEYMPYCEQLLVCAVEEQSDYLFALAYYYMMMFYAIGNDCINTVSCALEGIKYQRSVNDYEKLARSYNILGTFYDYMGDTGNCVDCLLSAIDISKLNNLDYVHFMALSNLADVFHCNANYDRALYYYDEAERYISNFKDDLSSEKCENMIALLCNKGNCMLSLNKLDEANNCGQAATDYINKAYANGILPPVFVPSIFFACLAYANNDTAKMEDYIHQAEENLETFNNYLPYTNDIIYLANLYINQENYDKAIALLQRFIDMCEHVNAPFNIYSKFMEKRIECAVKLKDNDDYLRCSQNFIARFQSWHSASSQSALRAEKLHNENLRMQKQQHEMHLQNEKLLIQSQHDTLTSLPNRAFLNSYAEETLSKATKNKTHFGIEILDIDYFKHLNDNYGHIEGDRYLKSVAELLQEIESKYDNVFAARYGGDEFVIVYYDKTDDEIREIMDTLKKSTYNVKLPAISAVGCNHLSLSQGCFNQIPNEINRLWDFLSVADVALYEIKQKGRNNFILKNRFNK